MYPVYKLLRAVNRQYPNNGFINYVDVTEDLTGGLIDEDLRDLLNETLQEIYLDIAVDEVYTFPTVAGQNQYELPPDCDLRDIQEVTRTYAYKPLRPPCPPPPTPGGKVTITFYAGTGTGTMEPMEVNLGETYELPFSTFTPPDGKSFVTWINSGGFEVSPGAIVEATHDETYTASYSSGTGHRVRLLIANGFDDGDYVTIRYSEKDSGTYEEENVYYGTSLELLPGTDHTLASAYDSVEVYYDGTKFLDFSLNEYFSQDTTRTVYHPQDGNSGYYQDNVIQPDPEYDDVVTPWDDNLNM